VPSMTQRSDAAIVQSPESRVQSWLADFESALAAREIDRVAAKFLPDSIWRDLVAFTWNIKTVEGRDGIADMLRARLADTDPSGFRIRETPANDGDDVVSAFIEFETSVGRAVGHLRLKCDLGWTLQTALDGLKGHEELTGSHRIFGAVHGPDPDTRSWAEKRLEEEASLGFSQQPYVLVVGGGQGGIALGARLRHLGVPAIVIDKHSRPGDHWRQRYKSCAFMIRCGTTTFRICRSRRTGRCFRRRTRSPTGWSPTPG
jgi:putative flavoprotein involved in K+ transport